MRSRGHKNRLAGVARNDEHSLNPLIKTSPPGLFHSYLESLNLQLLKPSTITSLLARFPFLMKRAVSRCTGMAWPAPSSRPVVCRRSGLGLKERRKGHEYLNQGVAQSEWPH